MFRSKLTKGVITLVVMFLFGLFSAWGVYASQNGNTAPPTSPPATQFQLPTNQTAANDTSAAAVPLGTTWVDCTPARVGVFTTRIHVKCTASFSGIWYFAYSTADDAEAARVLSELNSALLAGRTLTILYDSSDTTSGPPIGCAASDCRLLQALEIK